MSFEQDPPEAAPLPQAAAVIASVYRQDEFVRQPTPWTRPMQLAVAGYLVLSTLYSLVLQLAFSANFKVVAAKEVERSFRQSGRTFTRADISQAVDIGLTAALVFAVIFGLLFIGLAILTVTGTRTWVFWVDLVLLALGVFGLVTSVTSFTDAASSQIPSAARPAGLLVSLASLGLVIWMIVGLVRFGPWAREKVPAAL